MKFKSRATGDVLYVADSQAKTIRHMVMSGRYEVLHNDEWNESDHPRGEDGRFGSGGGSSAPSMTKQEMEHNLDRYKKNIAWMEKGTAPRGRKLRELEEYRQGYRDLKAQYEKEHDTKGDAQDPDTLFAEFKSKNPMGGISREKAGKLAREAYHLWQDTKDPRFEDLHNHYDKLMMGK